MRKVKGDLLGIHKRRPMSPFLYRCPHTGLRVQGWTAVDESEWTDAGYESIACLACGGVHLVNPKTGKRAGEKDG